MARTVETEAVDLETTVRSPQVEEGHSSEKTQQSGGPLTIGDLGLNVARREAGFRRPS
jgi:hypothetical protein